MKQFLSLLISLILLFPITMIMAPTADAAGAAISFPDSALRAGNKFSVTLNLALVDAITVDGTFSYSSNITLNSISRSIGTLDVQNNKIFVDLGNTPISGTKTVVVASFTVSNSAKEGDAVSISFSGNFSNQDGDTPISGSGKRTVAAPLSANCNLKSLTVGNAELSPAFSANITSYSVGTVEFGISRLDINAAAEDSKAKISIQSNNLAVGNNTVKIVVTAESGATKTYMIKATRKQDPNYVPGSDASLSDISAEGFLISPPFRTDEERYVVWLPYEISSIVIKASPTDSKASLSISGGEDLIAGSDNTIVITCTAEDGTKKEYYVIAKRAAQDQGEILPEKPDEGDKSENLSQENRQNAGGGLNVPTVAALCVICLLLGAFVMFLLARFNVIHL